MSRHFPWNILDLNPTTDEREIKIAYARKLKVTRPAEDPDLFQLLVEARDVALQRAKPRKRPKKANPRAAKKKVVKADETPNGKKSPSRSASNAHRTAQPSTAAEIETDDMESIIARIASFLEVSDSASAYSDAKEALAALAMLSLEGRAVSEYLLLRATYDFLTAETAVDLKSYDDSNRRNQQREIILALSDEFGWMDDDRRAEELLGEHGAELGGLLRKLKFPKYEPLRPGKEKGNYWHLYIFLAIFLIKLLGSCSLRSHQ